MEVIVGNKYILGKRLGGGSFGNIFEGNIYLYSL